MAEAEELGPTSEERMVVRLQAAFWAAIQGYVPANPMLMPWEVGVLGFVLGGDDLFGDPFAAHAPCPPLPVVTIHTEGTRIGEWPVRLKGHRPRANRRPRLSVKVRRRAEVEKSFGECVEHLTGIELTSGTGGRSDGYLTLVSDH